MTEVNSSMESVNTYMVSEESKIKDRLIEIGLIKVISSIVLEYITYITLNDITFDHCGLNKLEVDEDENWSVTCVSIKCVNCEAIYMPCIDCSIFDVMNMIYPHVILNQFLGYEYKDDLFMINQSFKRKAENMRLYTKNASFSSPASNLIKYKEDLKALRDKWWKENKNGTYDNIYREWVDKTSEMSNETTKTNDKNKTTSLFPPRVDLGKDSFGFDQHQIARIPVNWEHKNKRYIHTCDTECSISGPDGGYPHYWRCNKCYLLAEHTDK